MPSIVKHNQLNNNMELKEDVKEITQSKVILKGKCFQCSDNEPQNGICKICNGTGEIDPFINELKKYIENKVRGETVQKIRKEVQKSLNAISTPLDSLMLSLSSQRIIDKRTICIICNRVFEAGETVFYCILCKDFYICKRCEEYHEHAHTILKGRMANEFNNFNMKIIREGIVIEDTSYFSKSWLVENIGKEMWPLDTQLCYIRGDKLEIYMTSVQKAEPGNRISINMKILKPNVLRKYISVFRLMGNGKLFGDELLFEFEMKDKKLIIDNFARVSKIMEEFRKYSQFDKAYENSIAQILIEGRWDPNIILDLLKKYNNNRDKVLNILRGNN